jgi:predicted nucleic acid-binding Zn ribbon protein
LPTTRARNSKQHSVNGSDLSKPRTASKKGTDVNRANPMPSKRSKNLRSLGVRASDESNQSNPSRTVDDRSEGNSAWRKL